MAALSVLLAVAGAVVVVMLGPSGEAHFTVTARAPGAIVVPPNVLNSLDVPVRVTATRPDSGAVRLAVAPSTDARAVLATSAVSTVSRVRFPARTVDLHTSGTGPVSDSSTSDVWRLAKTGAGSATLVVDQGRGPETVVVTSGDATALTDVTVTLTWVDRTWFLEALAVAIVAALIAASALNVLWRGRATIGGRPDAPGDRSSEVTS